MVKKQIVALEARNKRNFKKFAVYSGIFLSAFMFSSFQEVLAMESDDMGRVSASRKAASTAYDQIKENFRVVVDGSRGRVTWPHWDKFKGNLFRHLDDSQLDQNSIWGKLKEDFRVQLVDAGTRVQWTDWDQLTQRFGQGVKLQTILQDLVNSRTPVSEAYAPYLPEGRYLLPRKKSRMP
jgi:hypothetical protein